MIEPTISNSIFKDFIDLIFILDGTQSIDDSASSAVVDIPASPNFLEALAVKFDFVLTRIGLDGSDIF